MKVIHGFQDEVCGLGSSDEGFFEHYGLNGTDTPAYVNDLLTIRSPEGMGFFEEPAVIRDSFNASNIGIGAYNKVPLVFGLEGVDPSMDGIWSSIKNVGKSVVMAPVKGAKAVGSGVKNLVTGGGKKKKGKKGILDNLQKQALDTVSKQGGAALKTAALDTIAKQMPKNLVGQASSIIQKAAPNALKNISKAGSQVAMVNEDIAVPEKQDEAAAEAKKDEGMSTAAKVGIGLAAFAVLGGAAWYFTSATTAKKQGQAGKVSRRPR